ncbi:MAG: hypothetical protein A2Z72_05435 [Omnitrophica bacterium RBG_13_46_9]|nr:MAG: hypothetical protein A2Z72_05435 [Omnitrophica bacterium RBG_13_46_9]
MSKVGRCTRNFDEALRTLDGDSIGCMLDIGCGTGRTLHLLERFKNAKRIGLDIDLRELKQAKTKCTAVAGSGSHLPFADNLFDLVVEFHTFHHIDNYAKAIKEVSRCLRKGGHFLMVEAVNDNPIFRFLRNMHPIARKMPIESNFLYRELIDTLMRNGFAVKSEKRFGIMFEFAIGGLPHVPFFVRRLTSAIDGGLERVFGTKYCASCVVLAQKR